MPHNEAAKTNPSAPRKTARDTHLFKLDASFQTSFRVTVSIMTFRTENSEDQEEKGHLAVGTVADT